ncbi:hypothetical protein [Streptomyces sp. NPDC051776]|uniref:hypothetical protein n=1 Tax=Streptomyces sp. NPDC051776 TaxID=3155414 RepID=UPI0034132EBE
MRRLRRLAVLALALVAGLAPPAAVARTGGEEEPFGATCRTYVHGSRATVSCHNPYTANDAVQLHIECERWWDPDIDTEPAEAGPAETVEMTGRCWMEIRRAWVTHHRSGT